MLLLERMTLLQQGKGGAGQGSRTPNSTKRWRGVRVSYVKKMQYKEAAVQGSCL